MNLQNNGWVIDMDMETDLIMESIVTYSKRKWVHADDHEVKTLLRKGSSLRDMCPIVNRAEGAIKARITIYRKNGEFIYLPQLPDRGWTQHDVNHLQSMLIDANMFHVGRYDPDVIAKIYVKTGRRATMVIRKVIETNSVQYRDVGLTISRCTDSYITYLTSVIHSLNSKLQKQAQVVAADSTGVQASDTNIQ